VPFGERGLSFLVVKNLDSNKCSVSTRSRHSEVMSEPKHRSRLKQDRPQGPSSLPARVTCRTC